MRRDVYGDPRFFFKLVGGPMGGQLYGMHEPYDSMKIIRSGATVDEMKRPGRYVRVGEWLETAGGVVVARAEWKGEDDG